MTKEDLNNRFIHHAPREGQPAIYERIRAELLHAANVINDLCPASREKSTAITKLEEAMFWANASIARSPES